MLEYLYIGLFTSTKTGKNFKINHSFNCDNNCLIHLLVCKHCDNEHRVEKVIDEFHLSWNNFRSNNRKNTRNQSCIQEHLLKDFNNEVQSGVLGNISITLTDKTNGKDPK